MYIESAPLLSYLDMGLQYMSGFQAFLQRNLGLRLRALGWSKRECAFEILGHMLNCKRTSLSKSTSRHQLLQTS